MPFILRLKSSFYNATHVRILLKLLTPLMENWFNRRAMKRFIALPIAVIVSVVLLRIAFAGPEPISSKEMKQVAPAPLPECNWSGFYGGALFGYARGDLEWIDRPESDETASET